MNLATKKIVNWYQKKGRRDFVSGGKVHKKQVQKMAKPFDKEDYRHLYEKKDWKELAKVLKKYKFISCKTCGSGIKAAKKWAEYIYEE